MSDIVSYSPLKIIDDWLICPAACRGEQIVGGSKGVCPLGRRARVHAPPEKGRQGVRTKFGPDEVRATVGRGNAKQFPLQVDWVQRYLRSQIKIVSFHQLILI